MARVVKGRSKGQLAGIVTAAFVIVSAFVGYGVAQSTQVTQAEWAVYIGPGFGPGLGQVLIFLSNLRTVPRARLSC